jgi:cell division protein FtsA
MLGDLSVGIDIGSHHVKVVAVGDSSSSRLPHIHTTGSAESVGMRHGYATDTADISENVAKAVEQAGGSMQRDVDRAHISVGGASLQGRRAAASITFNASDHLITEDDIERVIGASENILSKKHRQNHLVLHRFALDYKVDGQTVLGRPEGLHGQKLSVQTLFVTVLSQHAYDLVEAVETAGIEVDDIVAAPLAAAEVTLTDAQKIAGCVLANIGSETVSLVVFDNNQPISLAVFPIGSTDITNDIALGLKVSLEKAEQIKLGGITGSNVSKQKLEEIMVARLEDIFELIENHLEKINRQALLPAGIVMTGGGSSLSMVEDVARSTLDLPSSVAKLKLPKTKAIRELENSSWAVAYGTATLARKGQKKGLFSGFRSSKSGVFSWFKQFLP